jgi:excisionase family DNA binding protein
LEGWAKIKKIARYSGMGERTVRDWLKQGLKYSRLGSSTILIKFSDVDEYLESHQVDDSEVDRIVDGVMRDFDLK